MSGARLGQPHRGLASAFRQRSLLLRMDEGDHQLYATLMKSPEETRGSRCGLHCSMLPREAQAGGDLPGGVLEEQYSGVHGQSIALRAPTDVTNIALQADWWKPHFTATKEVIEDAIRAQLAAMRQPRRRAALEMSDADRFHHVSHIVQKMSIHSISDLLDAWDGRTR